MELGRKEIWYSNKAAGGGWGVQGLRDGDIVFR